MPGVNLITPPSVEPVTLVEARNQLRLDATGSPLSHPDDAMVTDLITAVRRMLDGDTGRLGRSLITQTWELTLDEFPVEQIRLPFPPLQSVISLKYDDTLGTEQTLTENVDYVVDTISYDGWVLPVSGTSWPATFDGINTVRIRYKAGYGDAATDVPKTIKQAMLLIIETIYKGVEPPSAVDALLSPYEVFTVV